jgi:hypothetical protein
MFTLSKAIFVVTACLHGFQFLESTTVHRETVIQVTDTLDACWIDPAHYAIIDCTDDPAWCLMTGTVCSISSHEVERTECVFQRFLEARSKGGKAFRDSIFLHSGYDLRPEQFARPLSSYFRQYAGELSADGDTLVHINALCHVDSDEQLAQMEAVMRQHVDSASIGKLLSWREGWQLTDDGGDCYFRAVVNLSQGMVYRFAVNGPYTPPGR